MEKIELGENPEIFKSLAPIPVRSTLSSRNLTGTPSGRQPLRKEELSELPTNLVPARGVKQEREFDPNIGAGAFARALVGGVDRPEDRLATLRQFYPDAQPAVGDPDNFEFIDPATGKRTLLNPPGLDMGDIASVTREGFQVAGGIGGAAVGVPGGLPGIAAGSTLGTAAGEEAFNLAAQALGMEDTRDIGKRTADTAVIGTAGLGGPVGGATAGAATRAATKGAFRGGRAGREEAARSIEDLKRFGTTPSVAQATQNTLLDTAESFLSRMPGGAGRIRGVARKTQQKVSASIERKTEQLAGVRTLDPETAGSTIVEGIVGPNGFVDRFRVKSGDLFNKLNKFIPGETTVATTNVRAALGDLANQIPDLPALNEILTSPGIRKIAQALPDEEIAYATLRDLRSAVGRKLGNPSLVDDLPRAELKQIYGAITTDLEVAATAAGPKALQSFKRANQFYKAGLGRIEKSLEPLIKNRVPERVFTAIESGARQGPTQLRRLRRSLTQDQWKIVVGTTIRRLGKATASQQGSEGAEFSFQTFLTNWNKIDSAAKKELFNAPGFRLMRKDLDALARASERIRESSQAFNNPSGTAGALIGQVMILSSAVALSAGDVLVPLTLIAAAGGGNMAARLMTSPGFVRWLAVGTKIKPSGFAAHIGRLSAVAAVSDAETKEAIGQYLGLLETAASQNQSP